MLVGDDFRFGAKRAGDYAMLDAAGQARGFDVARMNSYEVHGLRVSSSAVREALAAGDMARAAALLGRPYSISGHVRARRASSAASWAQRAGRGDGFRTLNLRFSHPRAGGDGHLRVRVHGLADAPLRRRGQPGRAPDGGRQRAACCSRCIACDWPAAPRRRGGLR